MCACFLLRLRELQQEEQPKAGSCSQRGAERFFFTRLYYIRCKNNSDPTIPVLTRGASLFDLLDGDDLDFLNEVE